MSKVALLVASLVSVSLLWWYIQFETGSANELPSFTSASHKQLSARVLSLEQQLDSLEKVHNQLKLQITELNYQFSVKHKIAQVSGVSIVDNELQTVTDINSNAITADSALDALGINRSVLELIQRRLGENKMALVSMRDRAAREGWIGTDKFNDALMEFIHPSHSLRSEFGDTVYDRYLYAMNEPNRVRVKDVYLDTAAFSVGILVDDIVMQYGQDQIYSIYDLRLATMDGTAGQAVLIQLLRDGLPVFVTVPQGPIGIELDEVRIKP